MPEPTPAPGHDGPSTPSAPSTAASQPAIQPTVPAQDHAPRKKRELPTRKNTNVRNLVWAIGLNLVIVAVFAVVVVGLGDSSRDTQTQRAAAVDISGTAERARDILDFPVAAPEPEGWTPREAKADTNVPRTWRARYTSPDGRLVTLAQQAEYSPALITAIGGTVRAGEPVTIAGASCEWLDVEASGSSGSKDGGEPQVGVACQGRNSGVVVYGGESRDTVRALAEHALKIEGEGKK